jgi:drug/metabolite transporter (DMT)-like permease
MNQPASPPAENRRLGIILVLVASLIFAVSDATGKLMVATLPPLEASWIRSVVVALLTLPVVFWRRGFSVLKTAHPFIQIGRAMSVWVSSLVFLTGLSYLPLAETSAINFIWPLLITVLSVVMLKEKVGIRRALATLVGFIGMLIIVRPGSSAFQAAALLPIAAAVLWAFASVLTRFMTSTESAETTIAWSALLMAIASTLTVPFVWVTPTWYEIGLGCIVGLGSATGHAMVIIAFSRTSASALAPYAYLQLVWATICGYVLFGSIPDRWIILGACVIVASGLYTIHRERIRRGED